MSRLLYWQAGSDNVELRDYLELTRDLFHRHFRMMGSAMGSAVNRKMVFLHDALKQTMQEWSLKGFFGCPGFGETHSWNPAFPELLFWRNIARYAGAHVNTESNDVLMAGNPVVALHALQPGRKKIRLPGTYRVRDVINDRQVSGKASTITSTFKGPDTCFYALSRPGA